MANSRHQSTSQKLINRAKRYFSNLGKIIKGKPVEPTDCGQLHSFAVRHLFINNPTDNERRLQEIYSKEGDLALVRDKEITQIINNEADLNNHKYFTFENMDEKQVKAYAEKLYKSYYEKFDLIKTPSFIKLKKSHDDSLKKEGYRKGLKELYFEAEKTLLEVNQKAVIRSLEQYVLQLTVWKWLDAHIKEEKSKFADSYLSCKNSQQDVHHHLDHLKKLVNMILSDNPIADMFKSYHIAAATLIKNYIKQRLAWEKLHPKKQFSWPYVCPLTVYGQSTTLGVCTNTNLDASSRNQKQSPQNSKVEKKEVSKNLTITSPHNDKSPRSISEANKATHLNMTLGAELKEDKIASVSKTSTDSNRSTPSPQKNMPKLFKLEANVSMPTASMVITKNPLRWANAIVSGLVEGIFYILNSILEKLGINDNIIVDIIKVLLAIPLFITAEGSNLTVDLLSWLSKSALEIATSICQALKNCGYAIIIQCVPAQTSVEVISSPSTVNKSVVQELKQLNEPEYKYSSALVPALKIDVNAANDTYRAPKVFLSKKQNSSAAIATKLELKTDAQIKGKHIRNKSSAVFIDGKLLSSKIKTTFNQHKDGAVLRLIPIDESKKSISPSSKSTLKF